MTKINNGKIKVFYSGENLLTQNQGVKVQVWQSKAISKIEFVSCVTFSQLPFVFHKSFRKKISSDHLTIQPNKQDIMKKSLVLVPRKETVFSYN